MTNPYFQNQQNALQNAAPQQTEGYALVQMARRLDIAAKANDKEKLASELRINWKIWTIIQAELLEENCPLPNDVRSNLLSLSNFIDKRTVELLGNPEGEKTKVLININRNIGAGLMGNSDASDTPDTATTNTPNPNNSPNHNPNTIGGQATATSDTTGGTASGGSASGTASAFAMTASPKQANTAPQDTPQHAGDNFQPIDKKT